MIQSCSCIKGSASAVELSRKQATASCKNCGGKQLINVRSSLSGSMLSTLELELTSAINPALSWKTVSKGNRSASRRARKFITRSLNGSREPVEDPKRVQDMPVSESEKIGVTILGGRFSDKIEHVPIKKRRFLFRSPSPPPQTPPCFEKSERFMMSQPVSDQESFSNVIAKEQGMAVDTAVLNERNSEEMNEKLSDNEDFSGISILAAAACNNNIGGGVGNAEEGSFIEESSAQEGSFEVLVNSESSSIAKTSCKENSPSRAEISNDGTESCISAMPVEETTASSKILESGKNIEGHFFSDNTVAVSQNLSSSRDDGTQRQIKSSLRDDRSHWDLNTSMDSWESPCDDLVVDSKPNAVISEAGLQNVNLVNLGRREVQKELGDTKYDMETTVQQMVGMAVVNDVHEEIYRLTDSRSLALGIHDSTDEDHKMDQCTGFDRTSCIQEKVPSDIDKALNSVMDLAEEAKPLHNPESFSSSAESVLAPVEHALKLPTSVNTSVVANGCASAESLSFRSTGNSGTVSFHQAVVRIDKHVDHHSFPGAGHILSTPVSEENGGGVSTVTIAMQKGYECTAEVQSESKSLSSPQAAKHEVALPCVEISKNATCKIDSILTEDAECVDGIADLCNNGNAPEKMMSSYVMSCQPLVVPGPLDDDVMHNAVSASDKVDGSQCSSNCEELPASCASVGKGEPVVAADTKVQDKVLVPETTTGNSPLKHTDNSVGPMGRMVDIQGGFSSHEACKSYVNAPVNSFDKVAFEEDFDDINYDSDVSQDDHGRIGGIEKAGDLQSGYDSQYEDGEFREPGVNAWEENVSEEGEAERVDYGSDNAQFEEVAESKKEKPANVEADQVMERNLLENYYEPFLGSSSKDVVMEAGSGKQRAEAIEFSCRDLLEIHSKKKHSSAHMDGLDVGDSITKVVGSTTSSKELSSRIEGPTSSILRKDTVCSLGNRSTNFDDSNHRVERDTNCCKSIGRGGSSLYMHGRGWGADHRVDSSGGQWGSRRCYSPRYYDPAGFGHPGPKNAAAAVAAKLESTGFLVARDGTLLKAGVMAPNGRIRRPTVNVSSQGVYRCFTRRGSPTDRDEGFGMRMGLGPVGEKSPGRSINVGRGRSGRYGPQVVGTGLRDRYHRPVPDGIMDSSFHMQHSLVARRERSFSPIQRRGAPHLSRSQTKSPSRSRARSPHVCSSPAGRNGGGIVDGPGLRHRSRSPPNFKYEARMERVRSPHHRSGFSAQHLIGFISPRSRRRSPQHTSGWIDDRRDAVDHFREHGHRQRSSVSHKRSPGRISPQRQRFDFVDSPGRLKSGEYCKPIHHPGRFPEMFGTGRGRRYEGSYDDRRKRSDRYGMVHPMRRYDRDGSVKRFYYGVEDAFAAHNSHNKEDIEFHGRGSPEDYDSSVDNRLGDEPRRAKGEKNHFRFGEDGKFNANSESSGMGDFDKDVTPRRRRSS